MSIHPRATVGAAVIVAALALPAVAAAKQQTTLRVNSLSDVGSMDPALNYLTEGWQAEYATCLKLVNYPDAAGAAGTMLVPDAATALPTVSQDGLTYTFTIRSGLRFSPPSGEQVVAATFKHAIERLLMPSMGSPAVPFFRDIVGAQDVIDGNATTASGIVASGRTLTITLVGPRPDLLSRLAMPFACAVPRSTPPTAMSAPIPSAGPYYVSAQTPGASMTLTRNPNYGGTRPHAYSQIVYAFGVPQAVTETQVENDQADYAADGLPAADYASINQQYGPGSSHQQFFVNPALGVGYIALNTSRPMMGHVRLRKAVNYALDRPALDALGGAFGVTANDQTLPPGMPGYQPDHTYPLNGPNLVKARKLAAGLGGPVVLYAASTPVGDARAHLIADELSQIGLSVDVQEFPAGELYARISTRNEPFDLALVGFIADYADPFDVINTMLDGRTIHDGGGNSDVAYFNDPSVNAAMDAAAALTGQARADAYASLDASITRDNAPWAVYGNFNSRDFVSAAVANVVYQPVYGLDLQALVPSGS
jgi:peptide/nickel transport system substrate-binding protein